MMEAPFHSLNNLFLQLGLAHDQQAIEQFIATNKLNDNEKIEEAAYWTPSQAAFINECLTEDSDWAEVVDQLNALLHE
jgi:hypothetical protein